MPSGQPVSCQGCLTGSDLVKQSNMGVFDQPPARHQLVRALGEPTLVATTWATKGPWVQRKKERKKWRTSLSPKAMGPRAAAGGKCAV